MMHHYQLHQIVRLPARQFPFLLTRDLAMVGDPEWPFEGFQGVMTLYVLINVMKF